MLLTAALDDRAGPGKIASRIADRILWRDRALSEHTHSTLMQESEGGSYKPKEGTIKQDGWYAYCKYEEDPDTTQLLTLCL